MMRRSTLELACTVGVGLACLAVGCGRDETMPPPLRFGDATLSMVLDVEGSIPDAKLHASMNSGGDTEVRTGMYARTSLPLDGAAQARLRKVAEDARFFTLPSTIGQPVPDGTRVVMTVTLGCYAHTVTVWATSLHSSAVNSDEAKRVSSVYKGVVDCIRDHAGDVELFQVQSLEGQQPVNKPDASPTSAIK